MKRQNESLAPPIVLPSIEGNQVSTSQIKGKFLLSFYRFASCPFCNMRVHQMVQRFDQFEDGFTVIAVFDSTIENLKKHASKHDSPFAILADSNRKYYKQYGIEKSVLGVVKGLIYRMPILIKGLMNGYIPYIIKGSMISMPADFLIDENGIIKEAYYGKDEGDHISFDRVIEFSKS